LGTALWFHPAKARKHFIEAFAGLYQDDLNLSLVFLDAVGDPVLGFAEVEVMRAQALEGRRIRSNSFSARRIAAPARRSRSSSRVSSSSGLSP
jgi:hypothetical protein